MSESSVNK